MSDYSFIYLLMDLKKCLNSIHLKIGCMRAREFESRSKVTNHRSNKNRDLFIEGLLLDFGLGEGGASPSAFLGSRLCR